MDVHHHIVPPAIAGLHPALDWSPERSLEEMKAAGVVMAISSIPRPTLPAGEDTPRLARECNDYAARLRMAHQSRFGMFATLPLPDVAASVAEIERALGALRADGVALSLTQGERTLADAAFAPVLEALNRRRAIAFVHPAADDAGPDARSAEVLRSVAQVLLGGIAATYPEIRWLFAYGASALAAGYTELLRMEQEAPEKAREALPNGVKVEAQKLFYETAALPDAAALSALLRSVPVSQVVYGSDFPFGSEAAALEPLRGVRFRMNELRLMERENAVRLMPRIALFA